MKYSGYVEETSYLNFNFEFTSRPKVQETEPYGEVFAGFFMTYNRFVGALEVSGSVAKREVSRTHRTEDTSNANDYIRTHNTSVELNNFQFSADLKPGFMFTPSAHLYGIVGLSINSMDLLSTDRYDIAIAQDPIMYSRTADKTVTALRLGLGLQENINDNWSIRMQYIYTHYGKLNVNAANTIEIGEGEDIISVDLTKDKEVTLHDWVATIGIAYRIPVQF